jgi:hypothetical protein
MVLRIPRAKRRALLRNLLVPLSLLLFGEYLLNVTGVFLHLRATSFRAFQYPVEADVLPSVRALLRGEVPPISPVNNLSIALLADPRHKCAGNATVRLLFVVKSAFDNQRQREAIRKTWGFESRFSDVPIRTIFTVGNPSLGSLTLDKLKTESRTASDILWGDFSDTYFNNTLKVGVSSMDYRCHNRRFWLSAHNCQVPAPTSQKLEVEQQNRFFGAD